MLPLEKVKYVSSARFRLKDRGESLVPVVKIAREDKRLVRWDDP
jgi:hypothetical protein